MDKVSKKVIHAERYVTRAELDGLGVKELSQYPDEFETLDLYGRSEQVSTNCLLVPTHKLWRMKVLYS